MIQFGMMHKCYRFMVLSAFKQDYNSYFQYFSSSQHLRSTNALEFSGTTGILFHPCLFSVCLDSVQLLAAVTDSLSKRKQQDKPTVRHMDCEVKISGFKSTLYELLYIFEPWPPHL